MTLVNGLRPSTIIVALLRVRTVVDLREEGLLLRGHLLVVAAAVLGIAVRVAIAVRVDASIHEEDEVEDEVERADNGGDERDDGQPVQRVDDGLVDVDGASAEAALNGGVARARGRGEAAEIWIAGGDVVAAGGGGAAVVVAAAVDHAVVEAAVVLAQHVVHRDVQRGRAHDVGPQQRRDEGQPDDQVDGDVGARVDRGRRGQAPCDVGDVPDEGQEERDPHRPGEGARVDGQGDGDYCEDEREPAQDQLGFVVGLAGVGAIESHYVRCER